jgi:hypothetical protein
MKTYAVIIPCWRANIPADWALEAKTVVDEEFVAVNGRQVALGQGDLLRTSVEGPAYVWLVGATEHGYTKEVQ